MITPSEIKQKAERQYQAFLRDALARRTSSKVAVSKPPFFPLQIRFRKPAASINYMELSQWVEALLAGSKAEKGYGYTIHLQTRATRRHGTQSIPQQITIDSAVDFLKLIDKQREFEQLEEAATLIRTRLPTLEPWLCANPQRIIANIGQWPELLSVCEWFVQNPRPNLYIREIPVDVHTKFIEENRGILRQLLDELLPSDAINLQATKFEERYSLRSDEYLVRIRLLDPQLQTQLNWPATDLSLPRSQFAQLNLSGKPIFITENKMTFLTLPPMPNTIALWGGGFRVIELGDVAWMQDCPITYWGDLDVQGFEILSGLRAHFPQVQSFLMDEETFEEFAHFAVEGTVSAIQQLEHLTLKEREIYETLRGSQRRLEQERVPLGYVVENLHRRSNHKTVGNAPYPPTTV